MPYNIEIYDIQQRLGYDLFAYKNIALQYINFPLIESLCYALTGRHGEGYIISKAILGQINCSNINITKDGRLVSPEELKEISIEVGIEREKSFSQELKAYTKDDEELKLICENYGINIDKLDRSYEHSGSERWRRSFALGKLMGKKLYCFPFIDSSILDMYAKPWLKAFIDEVKREGGTVLIPTHLTNDNSNLFDLYIR